MHNTVDLGNQEIELIVAALVSMSCPLCPLNPGEGCKSDPHCRRLAERIVGGELSVVFGQGDG